MQPVSIIHEYVVFDRAKVDPAFAMSWPDFERAYPKWGQWYSPRAFLVEWALGESQIDQVDEILARKTVGQTFRFTTDPFGFLHQLLGEKGLYYDIDIKKGNYDYGDELVSCAGAAFIRGDISMASLTAVYHLHTQQIDLAAALLPDVARAVEERPGPAPMFPGVPDFLSYGVDSIGILQSRRFINFLTRAWKERWPLHADGQTGQDGRTIRASEVAHDLVRMLRKRRWIKPCMFRWCEL
jgi:hypothetical protein